MMLQYCRKEVSKLLHGNFKNISLVFHDCLMNISWAFYGCFKDVCKVSGKCHRSWEDVHLSFGAAHGIDLRLRNFDNHPNFKKSILIMPQKLEFFQFWSVKIIPFAHVFPVPRKVNYFSDPGCKASYNVAKKKICTKVKPWNEVPSVALAKKS